jgi:Eco57I restriction-modification methylase/N-6 DNA Methylase
MDLEKCLSSIQSVLDLPRVVATLGHEPLHNVSPRESGLLSNSHSLVHVIGRTGSLPWFAIESSRPERAAITLARRLNRRGRLGLVLALDSQSHRLTFAVSFGKIPHLDLDLRKPEAESLNSLRKLARKPEGGPMAFVALAADALSTEPLSRRFFRQFRATLGQVARSFVGPMSEEARHDLALLQLTRVLFLYFIQTKGWLDRRERFLAEEVDRCLARGRHLHRDLLRPLFFGTLNQPMASRSRTAVSFGDIPFLNGGLFEPHLLERRYQATIANDTWRETFDDLFERFAFTVSERDPSRVAPDMLGRVFEGVMAPGARHESGTFYTPLSLVEQLLDTTLAVFLAGQMHCSERQAEQYLQDGNPAAAPFLSRLTLLDPAVGSGAFLLAALERLAGFEQAQRQKSNRKRYVLSHNLFGVDQSAAAVRLTELRLWLSTIAEDPAEQVEAVAPLPNLDCLVRQGDSLLDPLGWASQQRAQDPRLIRELTELRKQAVVAAGPAKRGLVQKLRSLEARALDHSLDTAEERHRTEITECLEDARAHDLFQERRGLDVHSRAMLLRLRSGLRQVRQARRKLARDGEVPWFHYQSHFADVFASGGFDVVVGNPPWLRSESLAPAFRKHLAGRYHWWRPSAHGFGKSPDLAFAFLERSFELTAPGGVVGMLVPAKLTAAAYGAAIRHALASTTTIHTVADLTESPAAQFDATVYPLAIVSSRSVAPEGHCIRTTLGCSSRPEIRQSELRGGGPWILVRNEIREAVVAMEERHASLGDILTCHLGVKTGANRIFLNPPEELEAEVLRPAIRGRDILAFRWKSRTLLLWTHNEAGVPSAELPRHARTYLGSHLSELRGRKDFRGGAPWTLFRTRPALARYRVVWADLARNLVALALTRRSDREHIPLNSCYVAPISSGVVAERVAAWLNSSWIRAIARIAAAPAAGGYRRFNARVVSRLPLPDGVLADQRLSRIAIAGRAGRPVQEELDDIAAQHLELSASAQRAIRAVVELPTEHRR